MEKYGSNYRNPILTVITKDYDEDEIEKLFSDEHIERKKLISPIVPTWEQRIEKWVSEDYIGKEFRKFIGSMMAEWMILHMLRTQSEKILVYEENGIYPGESLILTFETEKNVLNTRIIERLVHRYLL